MSRLLITGGSGLLALNWACRMRGQHEVTLAVHSKKVNLPGVSSVQLNLDSAESVAAYLLQNDFDVVVHTAGLTNVDECENNPDLAFKSNCELAKNVAIACHQSHQKLVHISTDHLFSGEKRYCTEEEAPVPVNVYARSKLCAEEFVLLNNSDALIIRTNFFGWGHQYRQSFSDWVIGNLENGKEITLFDDVFFTPILIDRLIEIVHELLGVNASGLFNIVSDERLSKYDLACLLAAEFGLPQAGIRRGKIANLKLVAPRPADMSLDNSKVRKYLGLESVSIKNQLNLLKLQRQEGRYQEIQNAIGEN